MAHILCSNNPINQLSLVISPIWVSLIGKEDKCDLGYVFCFSHVICCVLVSISTNRTSWLHFYLTILFLSNLFYSILLSVILIWRPILISIFYHSCFKKFLGFAYLEFIFLDVLVCKSHVQIMLMCALHIWSNVFTDSQFHLKKKTVCFRNVQKLLKKLHAAIWYLLPVTHHSPSSSITVIPTSSYAGMKL
jgi:hypothetical protein